MTLRLAAGVATIVGVAVAAAQAGQTDQMPRSGLAVEQRLAILDVEDARAPDATIAQLLAGEQLLTTDVQIPLVRMLGRLERPALIPRIVPFLSNASNAAAAIRAEAANALAQALHVDNPNPIDVQTVARLLLQAAASLHTSDAAVDVKRVEMLDRLLEDRERTVPFEALRSYAMHPVRGCGPFLDALRDTDDRVVVFALDQLGTPCASEQNIGEILGGYVMNVPRNRSWHLLTRLRELGPPADPRKLAPYVSDFDPAVATEAAALLSLWTGVRMEATPRPLPRVPLPTIDRLERLRNIVARVTIKELGMFTLMLLVDEAPLTASRFAQLVEIKYCDGLTFHRVEPNAIIQGGSPGGNEFAGGPRYIRDEVGMRTHSVFTVAMARRGRDEGE